MWQILAVGAGSGILFAFMDGLLNANPLARRLLAVYQPIAREKVNVGAGIVIDLVYGFALAGLFLLMVPVLPGDAGWLKGLSFGVITWFLRVVMGALSNWMMFRLSAQAVSYTLAAGMIEMLTLGLFYGLLL